MAIPLIVLAVGSILAGYVGVPLVLGGSNRIEKFLEPSFEVSEGTGPTSHTAATPVDGVEEGVLDVSAVHQAQPAEGDHLPSGDASTELMLMAISTGIAFAGIGIAAYFWLRNRSAAEAWSRRLPGLYRLLCNKYYVDELYDAAIVQPIKLLSTAGLWKGVDAGVIDGAVNGAGESVRAVGSVLRRTQTGSIRTYAASLFLGAALMLGWLLWR